MIKEITGKHVLFIMLTFFGIIFIVNGMLVYFSQSSWTGLETKDAYRKGLKYNQQLSDSRTQNDRAWNVGIKRDALPQGAMKFTVTPKDKNNEALTQLDISLKLVRPTHEGIDRTLMLKETGLGLYTATTKDVPLGKWYLIVTAKRQDQVVYRSKNELYLK